MMDQSPIGEPLDPSSASSSPAEAALAAPPGPALRRAPVTVRFRIGDVLTDALEILFGNIGTIGSLVAIGSLPLLVAFLSVANATADSTFGISMFVMFILAGILTTLCNAIVLHATFQELRNRPVRAAESARHGLARFLPVLAISVLQTLAIGVGMALLVVPGLILGAMFLVSIPVCVVERLGVGESMSRSARLTEGYRGPIVGGLLVLGGLDLVVGQVIQSATVPGGSAWAYLSYVWTVLHTSYQAVVVAVAYHALRVAKEGIDIDQIASVFD